MEEIVYLSIRIGCAGYLLYKVWGEKKRMKEICDRLYTPPQKDRMEEGLSCQAEPDGVMGATRSVYLDENAGAFAAPYMTQPLETGNGYLGEEEAVAEDEVECNLPLEEMRMLQDEQEMLDSQNAGTENVVPAVTSADSLNVGDVLFNLDGAKADEKKSHRAAMTLRAIRETDMFELISSQVENKRLIDELMDRYVDEEGNALPVKRERNEGNPVADWRKLV